MKTLITVTNHDLRQLLFRPETVKRLEAFSEVGWLEEGRAYTEQELASLVREYDACITSWGSPKLGYEVLRHADRLKFIGHAAGSVVSVVNEDVFDTPITVTNANPLLAQSTAEAAVAYMLAGAWKLRSYGESLRAGMWSNNNVETVPGLSYCTVGLIGYGEISRHVIRLLKPFRPKLLLYSRYCSETEAASLGVELCSLDSLLSRSDIISLHNTWTPATEKMIGSEQLRKIRDGALLVNTARGAIIDEQMLISELSTGRFQAVLDVYEREPLPADNPLLHLPNVWCLPHIGGFHSRLKPEMGNFVIEDLKRLLSGAQPKGIITRDVYKRLTPR
ncbi:hydroxyacid dehydrogenase [Paenibacillus sp. YN15]|uniref:hydroxyacid dehydrogenase n=1 Tax=Paenibacillus sp. YN15 TaxID=1742774 RepID=UPI0015ECB6FB|nr:hydroxyacid dehydrogenase [Paenibacillus sp. YN15]